MKAVATRGNRLLFLINIAIALAAVQALVIAQGTSGPGRHKKPDINQMIVVLMPPHP